MPISRARQIAFDILLRVASERAFASDLLHARLTDPVSRADAALATEVTLGALRWQRLLDFILQRHLDRPVERLDAEVLLALRMGLYQMRFLDRVPAHAAVSESVGLVKRARKTSAAPLVNAVLRRAAPEAKVASTDLEALLPPEASTAERLGILYSHPTWLVERWLSRFGNERTIPLLESNNRAPRLTCAVLDSIETPAVVDSLKREGFDVRPGLWLETALALSGGDPSAAEAFRSGKLSVQDEASQMVARLVDAGAGDVVLDVCSAPGGKTAILARAVAPQGSVVAADLHEHRLRAAREQLARTSTTGVRWLAFDATGPWPLSGTFQRILVDAPCSGTGTLARNPEIRWRLQPRDLADAHLRQTAILRQALAKLGPGGRLVYATCSLETEENEEAVRAALQDNREVRLVSGARELQPWLRSGASAADLFDGGGFFRTFPPESGTDGFFAAVVQRDAPSRS
jgi:16S rRNA (cytosine967-C5)-methyltransferase